MTNVKLDLKALGDSILSLNGPIEFVEDREAYGYIEDKERLLLPYGFKFGHNYFMDAETNLEKVPNKIAGAIKPTISSQTGELKVTTLKAEDFDKFNSTDILLLVTALNIPQLGNTENGRLGSLLRACLCAQGYLLPFNVNVAQENTRKVYIDETVVLTEDQTRAIDSALIEAASRALSSRDGRWILSHWPSICSILDCVFVSRGHHFVGEDTLIASARQESTGRYSYPELYRALCRSAFLDENIPFDDYKMIFRTSLHPFGVYVMRQIHKTFANERKLPSGLLLRAKPAPAGTAKVTTAAAILRMMRGSPFFSNVRLQIENTASNVFLVADRILDNPEDYHQNSTLLGGKKPSGEVAKDLQTALSDAQSLAPFLVGYVRTECAGAPISKQKTLVKPAEDQAGLLRRVERMFTRLDAEAATERPTVVLQDIMSAPAVPLIQQNVNP